MRARGKSARLGRHSAVARCARHSSTRLSLFVSTALEIERLSAHSEDVMASDKSMPVSLREWLRVWSVLAMISFGSAAVQLAAMHRILVDAKRWIAERRFLNALNYCIALPGPETQLLATYIGWLMHRTAGAVTAGGMFILPGTICMMAMSYGYVAGGQSNATEAIFFGLRPAVLVIVIESLIRIAKRFLRTRLMLLLAAAAFLASYFLDLAFAVIILGSLLIGLLTGLLGIRPLLRSVYPAQPFVSARPEYQEAEDQLAAHTRATALGFFQTAAFWIALWFAPVVAIITVLGWENVFSRIAVLFSEMAFLSVGGPYAVNTYVAGQAVDTFGWLTPDEVLDGFAMAELVPGPAIQFVQFVGFVAAFRNPGILNPYVSGTLGGLLVVWVTFIPTFLWILLIAPFIEVFRDNKTINAMLSAVTGGMLGIILTFALRFGMRTLFGTLETVGAYGFDFAVPDITSVNSWAIVIAVVASLALFRFKLGIVATLAASCAVGFIAHSIEPDLEWNLRSGLMGFFAGAAIGFPTGPVAVWCLHLRIQRRRAMPFAIILGSTIGDLVVAAGFIVITGMFGSVLASLQFLRDPLLQGSALIASGIALLFIVTRSELLGLPDQDQPQVPKWTYVGTGLAFLIAFGASITHPENLLAIGAVFTFLGIESDSDSVLLAGFFLGSLATWTGSIELMCRLGESTGRRVMRRVMQLLCILCIVAGIAQLGRWSHLFDFMGLPPR
jgi:chromate transporter